MTGAELRRTRRKAEQTQQQFATDLGVAPNTVARWERGERPIPKWVTRRLAADRTATKARGTAADRPRRGHTSKDIYLRLMKKYHPDKHPQNREAAEGFTADLNEWWKAIKAERE